MSTQMSARDAAQLLGVSRRTIYRWLEEGRLTWPIQVDPATAPTKRPARAAPQSVERALHVGAALV
jgi:predicted site-specific integrase-resolvase